MRRTGLAVLGILLAGSVIGAIAVENGPAANRPAGATAAPRKAIFGNWGVDLAGMDKGTKPGDDFFRYVNGAWFDKAVIPPDRTSTGSFLDLDIQSEDKVRAILGELEMRKANLTPDEIRVRDLYRSYLDTDRVEQLGLKPAEKDLQTIAAVKTPADVARAMGAVKLGAQSLFGSRIGIDDKKPDSYVVVVRQSGLGLPDRDYYLLDEKGIVAARNAYRAYIAQILTLGAIADADIKADAIFNLETEIARLHWSRAERRNADKVYNPMTVAELEKFAPQFPWGLVPERERHFQCRAGNAPFDRRGKIRVPGARRAVCENARGDMARLHDVPLSLRPRRLSAETLRRCALRFLRQGAGRPGPAIGAREARRAIPRRRDRGGRRANLCREIFLARGQSQGAGAGRKPSQCLSPAAPGGGLDVACHPSEGAGEARPFHREDRLSRQMARLFQVAGQSRRSSGQCGTRPASSNGIASSCGSISRSTAANGACRPKP